MSRTASTALELLAFGVSYAGRNCLWLVSSEIGLEHWSKLTRYFVRLSAGSLLPPARHRIIRKEIKIMKRRRYQYGCLTRKRHTVSEDVWQFRFYETLPDGRARRARVVGTVKQYPSRADALRAIEPFRVG